MSILSIQVSYRDGRPFAGYIYLPRPPGAKSVRQERLSSGIVIDYSAEGTPLGIEVVSPGHSILDEINWAFDHIGVPRPSPQELAPLHVA